MQTKGHINYHEVIQETIKNNRKLRDCKRHDFSIDATPERQHDKTYRCSNCGGEVDAIYKHWYEIGLEHGMNK